MFSNGFCSLRFILYLSLLLGSHRLDPDRTLGLAGPWPFTPPPLPAQPRGAALAPPPCSKRTPRSRGSRGLLELHGEAPAPPPGAPSRIRGVLKDAGGKASRRSRCCLPTRSPSRQDTRPSPKRFSFRTTRRPLAEISASSASSSTNYTNTKHASIVGLLAWCNDGWDQCA